MVDTGVEGGGAVSLGSQVGEMLSGMSPSEAAPEAATSAAESGAPPTETAAPAESAPAEPSETPAETAEGAEATPAADPASKEPEVDLLANAQSVTYTVDGQKRTYEGIKTFGEGDAYVTADALPDVLRKLGERDHLVTTNSTLYRQHQDLERLTEWTSRGADGKDVTLKGPEALEALRVDHGTLKAALYATVGIFKESPAKLLAQNEKGEIVWNPDAIEQLKLRSDLAERDARDAVRSQMAALTPAPQQAAPDVAKLAPAVIQQMVAGTDTPQAQLSPESVSYLTDLLPNFIRTATPDDRRLNPALKVGEPVVDPAFQKVVAQAVAQSKAVAKTAQTAASAASTNAARLAAAAASRPKPKAVAPAKPVVQRAVDSGDAWDRMEQAAAKAVAGAR